MNSKIFATVTTVALGAAGVASAQVDTSFDNLINQVAGGIGADEITSSVFSGAVNLGDVDGSVSITGGSALAPGSLDIGLNTTDTTVGITANQVNDIDAGNFAVNAEGSSADGVFGTGAAMLEANGAFTSDDSTTDITANLSESTFGASANLDVEQIEQNFGQINTVAAGALNDTTMEFSETGAEVMASAETTNTAASASSTTGGTTGFVTTALNLGQIDGSVSMNVTNANVGFDFASNAAGNVGVDALAGVGGINTTAAGALNTAIITMNVMGGEGRDADATAN